MKIEEIVALDVAPSARSIDENGYMHVNVSHITKAQVVPYWGHEIPAWEDRGLEKDKLYYAYRSPDELKKSISTWNGLPIHMEHHVDSADDPQKWTRVGSSGTDAKWSDPYVDNSLTIWDADAQEKIKDGTCKELSCAYRYTPDFTAGEFEGIPYDFVMRDIKGNHIALVEKGRAGRDVVVADAMPEPKPEEVTEPEKETEPKNSKRTGAESMPGKKNDVLENKALDDDILDDDVREKKSPVEVERDEDVVEIGKDHDDDLTEDDDDLTEDDDEDKTAEDDDEGEDDETKMDKFVESLNKPLADKLMGKLKDAFPSEGAEDDDDDDEAEDDDDVDKPVEDDDDDEPVGDDDEDDIKKTAEDDDEDDLGEDDDEDEEDEAPKMKAFVEALTDTQTKKLLFMLKARLMLGNKKDEARDKKLTKDNKPAKDCGPVKDSKPAMDADTIRRGLLKDFRARSAAVRAVRKTCGDLDPMAFDSASDIYGHALKTVGIAMDKYPRAAWAGMYAAYTAAMSHIERKSTRNIDPGDFTGAFAGLKNITIGE